MSGMDESTGEAGPGTPGSSAEDRPCGPSGAEGLGAREEVAAEEAGGRGGLWGRDPGSVGEWSRQVLPALLVLCCSLLGLVLGGLLPGTDGSWAQAGSGAARLAGSGGGAAEFGMRVGGSLVFFGAVAVLGTLVLAVLVLGYFGDSDFRRLIRLREVAQRVDPAVWLLDLAVVVSLIWSSFRVLMWVAIWSSPRSWWLWEPRTQWWQPAGSEAVVLAVGIQYLVYAIALAVAVGVIRARGGALGLAGLWPFWRNASCEVAQAPKADLKLAAALYFLFAGVLVGANLLNAWSLQWVGRAADENPMATLLQRERRPEILWVLGLLVTVGAAVAEEFLFRGLLYAVLRRHLGRWAGAMLGALCFSAIHGVWANLLSLFLLGLLLTWAYERSGRLLAPILLHALNNAIALAVLIGARGGG